MVSSLRRAWEVGEGIRESFLFASAKVLCFTAFYITFLVSRSKGGENTYEEEVNRVAILSPKLSCHRKLLPRISWYCHLNRIMSPPLSASAR